LGVSQSQTEEDELLNLIKSVMEDVSKMLRDPLYFIFGLKYFTGGYTPLSKRANKNILRIKEIIS
jgi:hypothetical protein